MYRRHVRKGAAGFGPPSGRALLLTALLFLVAPSAAFGHATLVSMEPRPDSIASGSDASRVVLRFVGSVDKRATQVEAVTGDGRRVDAGPGELRVRASSKRSFIVVPLRGGVSGPVFVRWRTISPDDGHPAMGAFDFAIRGTGVVETPAQPPGSVPPPAAAPAFGDGAPAVSLTDAAVAVARVLQDAALALAVGLVVFLVAVWRRVVPPGGGGARGARGAFAATVERRVHGLVLTSALVGVVTALAGVGLHGAVIADAAPWGGEAVASLPYAATTKIGIAWIAVAVAWIGVLVSGRAGPAGSVTVVLLALLVVSPALRGHGGWMAPLVALHVGAISAWVGGLVALVIAQRFAARRLRPRKQGVFVARLIERFGQVALPCALIVLLTGAVQATVALGGADAVLGSAYGRLVLVKIALFTLVLLVAARTRLRLQPRLRAASGPAEVASAVRGAVVAEVGLAALALAVAGLLAGTAPPA